MKKTILTIGLLLSFAITYSQTNVFPGVYRWESQGKYTMVKFYPSGIFEYLSFLSYDSILTSKGTYKFKGDTIVLNTNLKDSSLNARLINEKWLVINNNEILQKNSLENLSSDKIFKRNKDRERQYAYGSLLGNPIRIRDTNSFGYPLIIIDGVVSGNQTLNSLKPNEIENIEVIKGDNAITLFGERGKEGVVMIYTKAGRKH